MKRILAPERGVMTWRQVDRGLSELADVSIFQGAINFGNPGQDPHSVTKRKALCERAEKAKRYRCLATAR